MEIVKIQCPACGGGVEMDKDMEFGYCMYCGTKIYIPNAVQRIKGTVSIDNTKTVKSQLTVARRVRRMGEYHEAIKHYDAILLLDPDNGEANIYKGLCTAAIGDEAGAQYFARYGVVALDDFLNEDPEAAPDDLAEMFWLLIKHADSLIALADEYEQKKWSNEAIKKPQIGARTVQICEIAEALDAYVEDDDLVLSPALIDNYEQLYNHLWRMLRHSRREHGRKTEDIAPGFCQRAANVEEYRQMAKEAAADAFWEANKQLYDELVHRAKRLERELYAENIGMMRKSAIKSELAKIEKVLANPNEKEIARLGERSKRSHKNKKVGRDSRS